MYTHLMKLLLSAKFSFGTCKIAFTSSVHEASIFVVLSNSEIKITTSAIRDYGMF